jgi:CheY-like chemotaxis protein
MNPNDTILLAEDDENDAFFFRMALKKAGIPNPLSHVPDGEDAINYLAGAGVYANRTLHPFPSLIITDLKMPGGTGFDLLAWIQDQRQLNWPPVVVLSGSAEDSDRERALGLGAIAYFVKPPGLEQMVHLAHKLKENWLALLATQPARFQTERSKLRPGRLHRNARDYPMWRQPNFSGKDADG